MSTRCTETVSFESLLFRRMRLLMKSHSAVTFSPLHEPTSQARSAWWIESESYAPIAWWCERRRLGGTFPPVTSKTKNLPHFFASLPRPLPALTNKGKVFWFWLGVTLPLIHNKLSWYIPQSVISCYYIYDHYISSKI